MRVLITGAYGQLGHELASALREKRTYLGTIDSVYKDAIVVAVDKDYLDICDKEVVDQFIEEGSFDLIFNCAAFTDVDACEKNEHLAFAVNAKGAENLACAAERVHAKIVHVSTDYVFSGDESDPRIETDQCDPKSVYGKSKLEGERLVASSCQKHFIVRTAWLYGLVGNNFVKTMVRVAQENGSITVVNDQFGNPTNATDLAHVLLELAATDNYGIYHATNNGLCSWFEFACEIVDQAGIACEKIPCTSKEFKRLAPRPHYSSLDNKRLRQTIGDKMRPWDSALKPYLETLLNEKG